MLHLQFYISHMSYKINHSISYVLLSVFLNFSVNYLCLSSWRPSDLAVFKMLSLTSIQLTFKIYISSAAFTNICTHTCVYNININYSVADPEFDLRAGGRGLC